jgi:hypothetical protein
VRPLSFKSSNFKIVPVVIGLLGNTHKETLNFLDTLADLSDVDEHVLMNLYKIVTHETKLIFLLNQL